MQHVLITWKGILSMYPAAFHNVILCRVGAEPEAERGPEPKPEAVKVPEPATPPTKCVWRALNALNRILMMGVFFYLFG